MLSEFIYLLVGFMFGCIFMLNHKEWRQQKTYEQLDEKLRADLTLHKNLCESLKKDLAFVKQQNAVLKGRK